MAAAHAPACRRAEQSGGLQGGVLCGVLGMSGAICAIMRNQQINEGQTRRSNQTWGRGKRNKLKA